MRKGFTRDDLLAILVMACVLSILAYVYVIVPRDRPPGYKFTCLSNLHHMGLGCVMYTNDYGGAFPAGKTNESRLGLLYPDYVGGLELFDCPGDGRDNALYDAVTGEILNSDYFMDAWIPMEAHPMRAVCGDFNADGMNHPDGSCILFLDTHSKWVLHDPAGRHTNPHLPDLDTDIYQVDSLPRHPDDADLD